jgi:FkbM family methyltransferase
VALRARLRTIMRGALKAETLPHRPRHVDEMRPLLFELQGRGFEPRTILDVGAYDGQWSWMAAERYPSARFFLIEPQIELSASLAAFCERHPGSRWFQAGAGAVPGERPLTIRDGHQGSTFLPAPSLVEEDSGRQRRVRIVTIDSLLAEAAILMPDLVKLDVQGFELEALRGGQRLFGPVEVFILETSFFRFLPGIPLFHEVIAYMAERGYYAYDFAGSLRRPHDGALGQTDVCFARQGGILRASDRWS